MRKRASNSFKAWEEQGERCTPTIRCTPLVPSSSHLGQDDGAGVSSTVPPMTSNNAVPAMTALPAAFRKAKRAGYTLREAGVAGLRRLLWHKTTPTNGCNSMVQVFYLTELTPAFLSFAISH